MLPLLNLIRRLSGATSALLFALCFTANVAPEPVRPPVLGKLVDIGGYRVHLYCTGTGSPTVMVVGGGFSFDWGLVQPKVAAFTGICTYDPSGTAWSDPFPAPTVSSIGSEILPRTPNCAERVDEIHKLLENASIKGPHVLVGFSIGGLFARLYAHSYPKEVAGIIIVDHAFIDPGGNVGSGTFRSAQVDTPPVLISKTPISLGIEDDENFRRLPQRDQDLHTWAMSAHPVRPTAEAAAECIAVIETVTKGVQYPLGNTPLVVISTLNDSPNYGKLQAKLLSLSHDSRQIVAENSSHMVIIDEPEVIVSAIHEVVQAVRKHASLK